MSIMGSDGEETNTPDTEAGCDESTEHNGRHIRVDTGFYEVQVHGDPDDNLADLLELTNELADRAKADAQELDARMDNGDQRYTS